jgi:hypothetical protein
MINYIILCCISNFDLRWDKYCKAKKVTNLRSVISEYDQHAPCRTVFNCIRFRRLKALLSGSLVTSVSLSASSSIFSTVASTATAFVVDAAVIDVVFVVVVVANTDIAGAGASAIVAVDNVTLGY